MLTNSKILDYIFLWSDKLVSRYKEFNENCIFRFCLGCNTFLILYDQSAKSINFHWCWDKYRENTGN